MKYLVAEYDYEDCYLRVAEVPKKLSKKIFRLLNFEVIASGNFKSNKKKLNIKKALKGFLLSEKTDTQAGKEWEESKKLRDHYSKIAVSFSGCTEPADYLTKEQYVNYSREETKKATKHNKEIKKMLEALS